MGDSWNRTLTLKETWFDHPWDVVWPCYPRRRQGRSCGSVHPLILPPPPPIRADGARESINYFAPFCGVAHFFFPSTVCLPNCSAWGVEMGGAKLRLFLILGHLSLLPTHLFIRGASGQQLLLSLLPLASQSEQPLFS